MGTRQRFAIPDGWVARGFRFEVEKTSMTVRPTSSTTFSPNSVAFATVLPTVSASSEASLETSGSESSGGGW